MYMYMYMVMSITNLLLPPSFLLPPLLSEVRIGFVLSDSSVREGGSVMVRLQVMLEITLDIDVVVTVKTGDVYDSAGIICHYEGNHFVEDVFSSRAPSLHFSQWLVVTMQLCL